MTDIVGVIVAKEDSKRLPGKTFLEIGGRSMLERKIRAIQQTMLVSQVIVGTDSAHIKQSSLDLGCEVLDRDGYHCDESRCSANEMIYDMASRIEAEVIVWLHLTNPLVQSATIDRAVQAFLDGRPTYDSLCSVVAVKEHFWFCGVPLNFDPYGPRHPLAGQLEPYYKQNGAIFIQPRDQMVANRYFYGKHPQLFEMDEMESVDVNQMPDYLEAQAYYAYMTEHDLIEA